MIRSAGRIALALTAGAAFFGVVAGLTLLGWAFAKQDEPTPRQTKRDPFTGRPEERPN